MGKFKDWIVVTDAGNGNTTVSDGNHSIETDNTVEGVCDAIKELNESRDNG